MFNPDLLTCKRLMQLVSLQILLLLKLLLLLKNVKRLQVLNQHKQLRLNPL